MIELIRDTAFGQLVRLVSRNRLLRYPEERNPSICKHFIDEDKSCYLSQHGNSFPPEDSNELPGIGSLLTTEEQSTLQSPTNRENAQHNSNRSEESSRTRVVDENVYANNTSGMRMDSEKGRDQHLVTWYGTDDPGNSA